MGTAECAAVFFRLILGDPMDWMSPTVWAQVVYYGAMSSFVSNLVSVVWDFHMDWSIAYGESFYMNWNANIDNIDMYQISKVRAGVRGLALGSGVNGPSNLCIGWRNPCGSKCCFLHLFWWDKSKQQCSYNTGRGLIKKLSSRSVFFLCLELCMKSSV